MSNKMSKQNNEKYLHLLNRIYPLAQFNAKETISNHGVSHNVLKAMKELGMIYKISNGYYKWMLYRQPTIEDVYAIKKRITAYNTTARQSNGQLKLTPIKKVQQTQPVPVQQEPIHDTSNSKMLIIMAVGTILGFLIATLIWK